MVSAPVKPSRRRVAAAARPASDAPTITIRPCRRNASIAALRRPGTGADAWSGEARPAAPRLRDLLRRPRRHCGCRHPGLLGGLPVVDAADPDGLYRARR